MNDTAEVWNTMTKCHGQLFLLHGQIPKHTVTNNNHLGSPVPAAGCAISDPPLYFFLNRHSNPVQCSQPGNIIQSFLLKRPSLSFWGGWKQCSIIQQLPLICAGLQVSSWWLISQCVSWYTTGRPHSETQERIWVNLGGFLSTNGNKRVLKTWVLSTHWPCLGGRETF